jgi:ribosomal protein L24E
MKRLKLIIMRHATTRRCEYCGYRIEKGEATIVVDERSYHFLNQPCRDEAAIDYYERNPAVIQNPSI